MCAELTWQVLLRAQTTVPSKHADHARKELMRALSVHITETDACTERMRQELMRTLSMHIRK